MGFCVRHLLLGTTMNIELVASVFLRRSTLLGNHEDHPKLRVAGRQDKFRNRRVRKCGKSQSIPFKSRKLFIRGPEDIPQGIPGKIDFTAEHNTHEHAYFQQNSQGHCREQAKIMTQQQEVSYRKRHVYEHAHF